MTGTNSFRLTRRQLIHSLALAGIGSSLPLRGWGADGSAGPVITRRIPSTGEELPVMGVGTNRFGRIEDADARALLARMAELGGTVIDTAALYGESETVIGRALKELGLRDRMFLATKFNAEGASFGPPPGGARPGGTPPGGPPPGAPSGAPSSRPPMPEQIYGMASFERSLERLQTDHVDLLMAHFLDSVEPLMETMLELKKTGRTRYIGITTVSPEQHSRLVGYMREYPIDFIQVDYSLGSRSSAADVFPVAVERKIAVMVAVPFGGGRNSLFAGLSGRSLPPWAAEIGASSWSQLFLKYVISQPAVTCVIPGTTNLEHMDDNQAAGRGIVPDEAQSRRIESFWDESA